MSGRTRRVQANHRIIADFSGLVNITVRRDEWPCKVIKVAAKLVCRRERGCVSQKSGPTLIATKLLYSYELQLITRFVPKRELAHVIDVIDIDRRIKDEIPD